MSPQNAQTLTEIATFICSVGVSTFIAGMRWGSIQQELRNMQNRLSKIEGMFEMKLRDQK